MTEKDPGFIDKWKTPEDMRRWLAKRFDRLVAAELRQTGSTIDAFQITTPGLTAGLLADRFAAVRAWAAAWQRAASAETELEVSSAERQSRDFGRIRVPKTALLRSIDGAARLLRRAGDLAGARQRYAAVLVADSA